MREGKRDYHATGAGNGAREMETYTSTSLNVIKSTSFSSSAFGRAGRSCWTAVTVGFLLQHRGPKKRYANVAYNDIKKKNITKFSHYSVKNQSNLP